MKTANQMFCEIANEFKLIGQQKILKKLIKEFDLKNVTWHSDEITAYLKHLLRNCEDDLNAPSK